MAELVVYIISISILLCFIGLKIDRNFKKIRIKNVGLAKTEFRILSVIPIATVAIVLVILASTFRNIIPTRFEHAVFILALWILSAIFYFSIFLARKIRRSYLFLSLIGVAATIVPAIYFTPLPRFEEFFREIGFFAPLIAGMVLIFESYYCLFKFSKKIRSIEKRRY